MPNGASSRLLGPRTSDVDNDDASRSKKLVRDLAANAQWLILLPGAGRGQRTWAGGWGLALWLSRIWAATGATAAVSSARQDTGWSLSQVCQCGSCGAAVLTPARRREPRRQQAAGWAAASHGERAT